MKIIKFGSDEFSKYWNDYLNVYKCSFRYDLQYIKYLLEYSKFIVKNESFVVIESNKAVGICFLPVENIEGKLQFSVGNDFIFKPLTKTLKVEKKVFSYIDEIAKELEISKSMMCVDSISELDYYNSLISYGYVNAPSTNSKINLDLNVKDLWSRVRKGHKHAINKMINDSSVSFEVVSNENPNYEMHELYRKCHIQNSGKETRSKKSFDLQYDLLLSGLAILAVCKVDQIPISFNYFMYNENGAQYFSASENEMFSSKYNGYHYTLWNSILYLKKIGVFSLMITSPCGFNKVDGLWDEYTEKQKQIGKYKRGFGGGLLFFNRGVKYYSKKHLLQDFSKFLENLKVNLNAI